MKAARNIFRILVGLVFIFSGFVKGIDPLGTVYRMDDYFIAFGATWAMPMSLVLTIFLVTLEFVIGISLLFNLYIKGTAWILLPMMTYFTILTLFDALYNLVPDCGCFGDAVKLTNVQTFIKNLVLMGFVIPIFIWRKKYRPLLPTWSQNLVLLCFALAFGGMSVYAYRHLPFIDFMAWKAGNRVNNQSSAPVRFYVTYKNTKTGETKEYLAPNYPWNDSVWMSQWVFVSQRGADEGPENVMSLRIEDETGLDITSGILGQPYYHLIAVAYDLSKADSSGIRKMKHLYQVATEEGISFIALTSSLPEEVNAFREKYSMDMPFYFADDVVLKTMVRSNPGLILLNNGMVVEKWAWRDTPRYDDLNKKYFKQFNL
jgi:uncharacterized membrane protein YphA (DoxX/SURF4 family)